MWRNQLKEQQGTTMLPAPIQPIDGKLSDADLARRVAAGDQDAVALMMRRHNRTLYRAARSVLRDDAEAEDAVQDAYMLAFAAIGGFRGDAKLSTWLVRIVVNEAIGRVRKRTRRAEVIRLDSEIESVSAVAEANMSQASPEQPESAVLRAETRRLVEAKVDALPEAFRTVFVLRALEELSVEETAHCLAIPEATVRTRYFRARSLLRDALAREVDVAMEDAFAFAGARCDRIVAGVLARLADVQARHA
jgi:RNA polymerase sigma-70 factor, ECF subfamily